MAENKVVQDASTHEEQVQASDDIEIEVDEVDNESEYIILKPSHTSYFHY